MSALPPVPLADADTQAFWDGVARAQLLVPRCNACSKWIWQPRPLCPRCHTADPTWTAVSGRARVVSWTVIHPPVLPVWADAVPFVIVLVELDDAPGVRMLGQLVGDDATLLKTDGRAEGLRTGARVSVRYRVDEAGTTLPAWTITA